MKSEVESYKLGSIEVNILKTDNPGKLKVICNDGNYRSEFTIREYEYKNYKTHMNQRIKNAYKDEYKDEDSK